MPTNIASLVTRQGSHTFNLGLTFSIPGYADAVYHDEGIPDTWQVRIVNPEGVILNKTTGLEFLDPVIPVIYAPIEVGDLDKAGIYRYQVIKTTDGASVKSEVGEFVVEESVPSLTI